MSLTVLAPKASGLAADQNYLLDVVRLELAGNFAGYSAIGVLDWGRLQEHYDTIYSGYYDDDKQEGYDLGHLTTTHIMGGTITRTATGYTLQMQITKAADKMITASYSGTFPFAELDNRTGVRKASLELLGKMGVTLTARAQDELSGSAAANQVSAQTALAQGSAAQLNGNTIESRAKFYEANNYDSSFAEAATRVNTLSATVRTGNIREDAHNDIAWRREWIKLFEDALAWYKANPPFEFFAEFIYDSNLEQGSINYQTETIYYSFPYGFKSGYNYFDTKIFDDLEKVTVITE
jgi:hypothetical protein